MIKLPTYKQIKDCTDNELKEIYFNMSFVPFSETDGKFFRKSEAVHTELVNRKLGYFDSESEFHLY